MEVACRAQLVQAQPTDMEKWRLSVMLGEKFLRSMTQVWFDSCGEEKAAHQVLQAAECGNGRSGLILGVALPF